MRERIAGIAEVAISLLWFYRNWRIMQDYQIEGILYAFMISHWVLVMECLVGVIGVVLGILVFTKKMRIKIGFLAFALFWAVGFIIEFLDITF
ncbi:hypothetical protein [Owenweeksia hongkongensis]|uniref:hypothetical protein n=1 Tax=Owenweeksia hongkongensis TaxID=253245 RepID=UPI003A931039